MTDDQLREALDKILGRKRLSAAPGFIAGWYEADRYVPHPIDWTTAGALLEKSPHVEINGEFGAVAVTENDCGAMLCLHEWPDITARNVIEACVLASEGRS